MSANTAIEWTDRTWNPVRGCSRVSEGCRNCYAERQAIRHAAPGRPYAGLVKATSSGPRWTGRVELYDHILTEPLSWRKPARVFVNSMSDLFHEALTDEQIDRVFAVMALSPQHTFQVLTKRPERMRDYVRRVDSDVNRPTTTFPRWRSEAEEILTQRKDFSTVVTSAWPLRNVWLGVSVENQQTADARIPLLLETPAAMRFISAEPLLGPIDIVRSDVLAIERCVTTGGTIERGLDWIIVGGESGPGARPCDVTWVRNVVRQCNDAGVPVFVKQLGSRSETRLMSDRIIQRDRKGGDPSEWPEDLRVREFPGLEVPA